jgi:hypothetical protein
VYVSRLILAAVLLVQTGPVCACAVDHALLCDGPHGSDGPVTVEACGDARCGAECSRCPRHHEGGGCSRSDSVNRSDRASLDAPAPVALALLTPPAVADPAFCRDPLKTPAPEPPPGSTRSIPMQN